MDRLIRESLTFQTTPKSACEVLTGPIYALILTGSRLVSKEYKIAWIYDEKHGNRDFSDLGLPTKNTRNSPWSTPPELIFVSFGSQESHLSNDPEIRVKGVDHAKLWIVLGWSKEQPWGTHGPPPSITVLLRNTVIHDRNSDV